MSKSFRREVAKKLKETIDATSDPKLLAELANVLAKYLPKPKSPKRGRGTPVAKKEEEVSLDKLVAAVEKKRKEARNSLNSE